MHHVCYISEAKGKGVFKGEPTFFGRIMDFVMFLIISTEDPASERCIFTRSIVHVPHFVLVKGSIHHLAPLHSLTSPTLEQYRGLVDACKNQYRFITFIPTTVWFKPSGRLLTFVKIQIFYCYEGHTYYFSKWWALEITLDSQVNIQMSVKTKPVIFLTFYLTPIRFKFCRSFIISCYT